MQKTGQTVWGARVSTWDKGLSFCPHVLHGTLPWTGDRWAITAFTPKGLTALDATSRRLLLHWGFPWCPHTSASDTQTLHQLPHTRAVLVSRDAARSSRQVVLSSPQHTAQEPSTLPRPVPQPKDPRLGKCGLRQPQRMFGLLLGSRCHSAWQQLDQSPGVGAVVCYSSRASLLLRAHGWSSTSGQDSPACASHCSP